ncbi:Calcineurin-like phosphoesterase [uncultured archaeon]|nr:Calcineurin-like phosphoesterase [uncultured archaeon]
MLISLIKGAPALLIRKERVLVVGDLHIGIDLKYRASGIHFQGATNKLAEQLLETYKKSGARSIVILGDVKESIGYPRFGEFMELKRFFEALKGIDIRIVKGNHDGGLDRVLKNLELNIVIEKEVLTDNIAMIHGNAWPSDEAMQKRYLITAHEHLAIDVDGKKGKVWLIAKASKKASGKYVKFNKDIKLVVVPPFNELVLGSEITEGIKKRMPLFRENVFDWKSARAYDLEKGLHKVANARNS